jgi:hypothetical protein
VVLQVKVWRKNWNDTESNTHFPFTYPQNGVLIHISLLSSTQRAVTLRFSSTEKESVTFMIWAEAPLKRRQTATKLQVTTAQKTAILEDRVIYTIGHSFYQKTPENTNFKPPFLRIISRNIMFLQPNCMHVYLHIMLTNKTRASV